MGFIAPLIGPIAGAIGGLFGHGGSSNQNQNQSSGGGGGLGGALGQLGGAVGSSLLGGALGKIGTGPTSQEQNVLSNAANAQRLGMGTGQNLLGMGTGALQQPLNYWSSILSGNKGLMTSALAPEISQIGQGYQTAANTSAALNPRGGPGVDFLSQLPWAQQRDVSSLFQQARPAAAGALAGTGQNLLGAGTNALYASTSAGRDILNQQEQMMRRQQETGQGIGKGLFSIISGGGGPAGGGDIVSQIMAAMRKGGGGGGGFNPNANVQPMPPFATPPFTPMSPGPISGFGQ